MIRGGLIEEIITEQRACDSNALETELLLTEYQKSSLLQKNVHSFNSTLISANKLLIRLGERMDCSTLTAQHIL